MNRERIRQLADTIERVPHVRWRSSEDEGNGLADPRELDGFNMRDYLAKYDCGTCGCIAGWAFRQFSGGAERFVASLAGDLLGLNDWEAMQLFEPPIQHRNGTLIYEDTTPAMAARVLRAIADGSTIIDAWDAERFYYD